MKKMSRRDVCVGLPVLAVLGGGVTRVVEAQAHASEYPAPPSTPPAIDTPSAPAAAIAGVKSRRRAEDAARKPRAPRAAGAAPIDAVPGNACAGAARDPALGADPGARGDARIPARGGGEDRKSVV